MSSKLRVYLLIQLNLLAITMVTCSFCYLILLQNLLGNGIVLVSNQLVIRFGLDEGDTFKAKSAVNLIIVMCLRKSYAIMDQVR